MGGGPARYRRAGGSSPDDATDPIVVTENCHSTTTVNSCTVWFMIVQDEIIIESQASAVWAVFTDVEQWPTWTESVTSVELLDTATLGPTSRARIKQPRFPTLLWTVTAMEPGTSWSWTARSPGATTIASHQLEALGDGRTRVVQTIDQRGPLGVLVGLLTKRLTRRYLAMEAAGLKHRVEADVPAA